MIQSYRTVTHFRYFSAGMVNHRQHLALIFRIGGGGGVYLLLQNLIKHP